MKKYLLVYLAFLKINFSMLSAFRSNFYLHTFSALLWGGFQIATILLLTSRTGAIFDWSREELIILIVMFNILVGVFHTFFSANLEALPEIFHLGEFDSIVSKPLSSQYLISLRNIFYPSLVRAIVSFGFLVYLLNLFRVQVSFTSWILALVSGIIGLILLYSLWMIVMTLCVWNTKLSNLYDFLITLNGFSRFPTSMFQSLKSILIVLILPFVFVVNLPASIILGKPYTTELIATIFLTIFFFLISILFWNFALKSYTSASS